MRRRRQNRADTIFACCRCLVVCVFVSCCCRNRLSSLPHRPLPSYFVFPLSLAGSLVCRRFSLSSAALLALPLLLWACRS